MRVLAIDTALGATSVALFDAVKGVILAGESIAMERGQAEALVPMVQRVVDKAGLEFSTIDRIAVTIGPGSFTGLRIGIAAARGFALAYGKPAVGVSTLAAFSAPVLFGGERMPVAAAIDARQDMVFFQLMGADGRVIAGPGLISAADAARRIGDGAVVFVGNAAARLARAKKETMPDFRINEAMVRPSHGPDIVWVARLGAAANPVTAPARPLYLQEARVSVSESGRLTHVSQA